MNQTVDIFIQKLSSGEPTPGGGGASALIGAIGVALCSMVANLTSGKKKYAEYQNDIEEILQKTQKSIDNLLYLIQKDADVFTPLASAYGIPKDDPSRDEILENALRIACSVPSEILTEVIGVIDILEELTIKGSKLAISDVGVAASACKCAIESAVMNIYINTKLMNDMEYAERTNRNSESAAKDGIDRCQRVYEKVLTELR